jgi:hypothetical protein
MGRTVERPRGIDDFTIALPELRDIRLRIEGVDGLDRLWRGRQIQDDSSHRNQSGSLASNISVNSLVPDLITIVPEPRQIDGNQQVLAKWE